MCSSKLYSMYRKMSPEERLKKGWELTETTNPELQITNIEYDHLPAQNTTISG